MKKYLSLLLPVILICRLSAQDRIERTADSLAKAYLQNRAGALVIGIHDNGKEKIFYYGETKKSNGQKPDGNSLFEIGSISETFTSVLYADMCLKGIINADDKLQDFLPVNVPAPVYQKIICQKADETSPQKEFGEHEHLRINFTPFVCFPDPSTKPQFIILCDLATHTTGLPQYPYNLKKNNENPFADYTKEDLYDFIKEFKFSKPIGYDYTHSAVGIALLGHALSLKTKVEFEKLITDSLFVPFQMGNTRINYSQNQPQQILQGYDKRGNPVPDWTYDVLAPSGGISSSANDMMKFLAANISTEKNYYSHLLDYTHNPRIKLSGNNKDTEIALGWKINSLDNSKERIVWQKGLTDGFSSYIGFVETSHTGVIILSSIAKDTDYIGKKLLKVLSEEKL